MTESFLHWGQRISEEIGATFKMQDGKAIFLRTNAGQTAGGVALPAILATYGQNLLTWRIRPVTSRPRHGKVRARFYDDKKARWEDVEVEVDPSVGGTFTDRFTSSSKEAAGQRAGALKARSERNSGEGSVTLLGDAKAKPDAPLVLTGARAGIDGTYRIESIQHNLTKAGGYVMTCEVRQPSGEAGKDERKPTAAPGSPATASTSSTSTGRAAGPA